MIKKNNKGSSTIVVLMAVALITVLATMVLAMVMLSYNMRVTGENTTKNFYSCETALDEIKAGLQIEASECYIKNYLSVQLDDSIINKESRFSILFKNELASRVKGNEGLNEYDIKNLKSYLSETVVNNIVIADSENNSLIPHDDGLMLKNVDVTYTKDNGSKSRIVTDVFINYPGVAFKDSDNPPLMEYAIVADKGVNVVDTKNYVSGSIYAGGIDKKDNSLKLNNQAEITLNDSRDATFNGDILMETNASFNTSGSTGLWARNIITNNNNDLLIHGYTNILNDLIIEDNCEVTLEGSYYGFGDINNYGSSKYLIEKGITEDDKKSGGLDNHSGAILVNGTNVDLEIEGLRYLTLGGTANIGIPVSGHNFTDQIKMGESIGIKGTQLAYLVPNKNMKTSSNPVAEAEYEEFINNKKAFVNTSGISGLTEGETYKTVFYPISGDTYMVYFFLNFKDVDSAAKYFRSYYNNNKTSVNKALDYYVNLVDLPREVIAETSAEGNIIGYKNDASSLKFSPINSNVKKLLYEKEDVYAALCTVLKNDYDALKTEEKNRTVYNNLVDTAEYDNLFTGSNSGDPIAIFNTAEDIWGNTYEAMVINSDVKRVILRNNTFNSDDGYEYNTDNKVLKISLDDHNNLRLLISEPKIVLNGCDYNGLMIGGNFVRFNNGAKVISNPTEVILTLQAKDEEDRKIIDVLINGKGYIIGGSGEGTVYEDLVSFRNWKKE